MIIRKALIPTIAASFFVANLFQLCLNSLTVLLRISTLPEMSADFSILAIAKIVLEHRESDNRHAIINIEQTTVIVLPRGKIQYLKLSYRRKRRRLAAIPAVADELQITTAESFDIFVDQWAQKRSKTEPETAVVDALLPKFGTRCPFSDTEAEALLLFQKDP